MALYKKAEFAAKCGLSPGNLGNYIKREKVKVMDNGMIDDSELVNIEFLKRRESQGKTAKMTDSAEKTPVKATKSGKKAKSETNQPENRENGEITRQNTPDPDALLQLNKEQKRISIENMQYEQQMKIMQIQKIQGKTIPTELVKLAIAAAFKATHQGFKHYIESLITDIAQSHKMNINQQAEWKGKAIQALNRQISSNNDAYIKAIDNIVNEYTQVKAA